MTPRSMFAVALSLTQVGALAACGGDNGSGPPGPPGPPGVPTASFPTALTTRWLYADTGSSSGASGGHSRHSDTLLLVIDSSLSYDGRAAVQVRTLPLAVNSSWRPSVRYLAQDATGVYRQDYGVPGWRMLLSKTDTVFYSVSCWSMDHDPGVPTKQRAGQVTVPAGAYTTAYTWYYAFQSLGGSVHEESCEDQFADGVGLVRSRSFYDDSHEGIAYHGEKSLLAAPGSANLPAYVIETEPNDTSTTAQVVTVGAAGVVLAGDGAAADGAAVLADPNVQVDTTGVRRMQDWIRLELSGNRLVTLQLLIADLSADFDLYLFRTAPLGVVASSINGPGNRELIAGQLTAGTYYIGVQFWNHHAGRSKYWLYLR